MAYIKVSKPYPPCIESVSSIDSQLLPPGVCFKVGITPYHEDISAGVDKAYMATIAETEQETREFATDIMTIPTGETDIPLSSTSFSNVDGQSSQGYLDFTKIPEFPKWFGKPVYFGMRRNVQNNLSDITVNSFYYPHLDEPLYEKAPLSLQTPTERVLTRLWTYSATLNNGATYDNGDSFQLGDVCLYFNSLDKLFHKVCFVISFYDHASIRNSSIQSTSNLPYNSSGTPVYFAQEYGSAKLYNPELANELFAEDTEGIKFLLDNYTGLFYTFPTIGSRCVGLIGNITLTNTFDGIRFRLNSSSTLVNYPMYLHVFIDGHYANTDSVLVGRGSLNPLYSNSYVLNNDISYLSNLIDTTNTAVRFNGAIGVNPVSWTITKATEYIKGCPSDEVGDC